MYLILDSKMSLKGLTGSPALNQFIGSLEIE